MTFKRYIAHLLLICFSAFLGHNLVPHHHHSEVYHSPVAADCPFEHSDTHEHDHDADEHPTHCHAFNDVVFQKHSSPALQSVACSFQAMMVTGRSELNQPEENGTPCYYAVLKPPSIPAVYPGSRGLRAPPVFA